MKTHKKYKQETEKQYVKRVSRSLGKQEKNHLTAFNRWLKTVTIEIGHPLHHIDYES